LQDLRKKGLSSVSNDSEEGSQHKFVAVELQKTKGVPSTQKRVGPRVEPIMDEVRPSRKTLKESLPAKTYMGKENHVHTTKKSTKE